MLIDLINILNENKFYFSLFIIDEFYIIIINFII